MKTWNQKTDNKEEKTQLMYVGYADGVRDYFAHLAKRYQTVGDYITDMEVRK